MDIEASMHICSVIGYWPLGDLLLYWCSYWLAKCIFSVMDKIVIELFYVANAVNMTVHENSISFLVIKIQYFVITTV